MDKPIRKAVRCYLIKDNEVVVTKYKKGNKKEGYYDIPGGKIEEGEIPKQTAIREMKEETGIEIQNLKYKGIIQIGCLYLTHLSLRNMKENHRSLRKIHQSG